MTAYQRAAMRLDALDERLARTSPDVDGYATLTEAREHLYRRASALWDAEQADEERREWLAEVFGPEMPT